MINIQNLYILLFVFTLMFNVIPYFTFSFSVLKICQKKKGLHIAHHLVIRWYQNIEHWAKVTLPVYSCLCINF